MAGFKIRALALVAAVAGMAACSDSMISAPTGGSFTLAGGTLGADAEPIAGQVKLCTFDAPGTFTTSEALGAGAVVPAVNGVTIEQNTSLVTTPLNFACSVVWLRAGRVGTFRITTTQVGPPGWDLDRLVVKQVGPGGFPNQNIYFADDPAGCAGSVPIPASPSIPNPGPAGFNVVEGAGYSVWYKQCPPTPPVTGCSGLTPGFWKNWNNHFTNAQFDALIAGTTQPGLTRAAATTILSTNNPALPRLKKFLLANELTLSLTAMPPGFPKKSAGSLSGGCMQGNTSLAAAIAAAKLIIANPGGYTNQQILDAGTLLDNFANM